MKIGYNLDSKELELIDNILSKGDEYVIAKIEDYKKSALNPMFSSNHAYYKCCLSMINELAIRIDRLDIQATIGDIHDYKLKHEKVNGKIVYQKPEKVTKKPRTKKVKEVTEVKEAVKSSNKFSLNISL